jgi:hypothetical protein
MLDCHRPFGRRREAPIGTSFSFGGSERTRTPSDRVKSPVPVQSGATPMLRNEESRLGFPGRLSRAWRMVRESLPGATLLKRDCGIKHGIRRIGG